MANEQRLGATFSIDTTDLKNGLAQANRLIRESESEFKAVAAETDDWTQSIKGVEARITHLNTATDLQRKKVDALQEEYDKLIDEGLDPTSKAATDLKTKLNNETAVLNKNERELKKQQSALEELSKSTDKYGKETDDSTKKTKKMNDAVDKSEKSFDGAAKAASVAAKGIVAIGAAAAGAITGFLGLAESTREYREDMNKLQSGFKTAGFTAEQATEVYKNFYSVLGESDRSVEAVNHLAKLCTTQEELNTWTDIATGVWATFGDSLPIEGLTEAANETARVGDLTGVLADALNWAGVNEDEFQKQLDACNNESERAALITETLNSLYSKAADNYKELNKDVMDAQKAQSELTDAIAELGAIAEPIMTELKYLVADLVEEITPFVELIGQGFQEALSGSAKGAETLAEGLSGILDLVIDKIVDILPTAINTLTALIPSVIGSILDAMPQLLEAIVLITENLISSIDQMIPTILDKILEIVPTLIIRLLEQAPTLLQAAVQLLKTLTDAVPVIIDELITVIPNIINAIFELLIDGIPILFDGAIQLLMSLVDAIPIVIKSLNDNLPRLLNSIINGVLDSIPVLLDAAIDLLMAIVDAIPKILPSLISSLPKIINTIVSTLGKNLPNIISAAFDLLFGIIDAIPMIQAELVRSLPSIISSIVTSLISGIPDLIKAGADLLEGLIKGLLDFNTIKRAIGSLGNSIVDGFKSFFGIHSPSKLMEDEIGKNLALGIGEGFEDNIKGVKKAMVHSLDNMNADGFNINANGALASGANRQVVVNQYNNYSQTHSRYEIYKSQKQTAAAVRLALGGSN